MYHYALLNSLGDVVALFITYRAAMFAKWRLIAKGDEYAVIEHIV